jgi:hypothetical protein
MHAVSRLSQPRSSSNWSSLASSPSKLGLPATASRKAFKSCVCGTSPEAWVVESFFRLTSRARRVKPGLRPGPSWGCGHVRVLHRLGCGQVRHGAAAMSCSTSSGLRPPWSPPWSSPPSSPPWSSPPWSPPWSTPPWSPPSGKVGDQLVEGCRRGCATSASASAVSSRLLLSGREQVLDNELKLESARPGVISNAHLFKSRSIQSFLRWHAPNNRAD